MTTALANPLCLEDIERIRFRESRDYSGSTTFFVLFPLTDGENNSPLMAGP